MSKRVAGVVVAAEMINLSAVVDLAVADVVAEIVDVSATQPVHHSSSVQKIQQLWQKHKRTPLLGDAFAQVSYHSSFVVAALQ